MKALETLSVRHLSQSSRASRALCCIYHLAGRCSIKKTEVSSTENMRGGPQLMLQLQQKPSRVRATRVAPAQEKTLAGMKTLSSSDPWPNFQPKLYSRSLQTSGSISEQQYFSGIQRTETFFTTRTVKYPPKEKVKGWQESAGIYPDNHKVWVCNHKKKSRQLK